MKFLKMLFVTARPLVSCMFLILCATSCFKFMLEDSYYAFFFIKNTSDRTIDVRYDDGKDDVRLTPGDSTELGYWITQRKHRGFPEFGQSFRKTGVETLRVFLDGKEVRVWSISADDDRSFFAESSWRYYIREYNGEDPNYFIWVFDILQEDIKAD